MSRRLVVVGAGGIGGGIGGMLHRAGTTVVLVQRGAHGAAIRDHGLSLSTPTLSVRLDIPCVAHPRDVDWQPGDVVLLSTKLQDAEAALDDVLAHADPDRTVVIAQNGIHGEQWAASRFRQVLSMLVWLPALYLEPGRVRLHGSPGNGVLDSGPVDDDGVCAWLCAALVRAGFDAVPQPDIVRWKRAKFITNLGGVVQALGEDWSLAREATAEGEAVMAAAGWSHVSVDTLMERCAGVGVADVEGDSRPGGSTWQSVARGVPLETRHLNGALVALADELGVPVPVNRGLCERASRISRGL
jgi:2-dehydropantoate 2-reductase